MNVYKFVRLQKNPVLQALPFLYFKPQDIGKIKMFENSFENSHEFDNCLELHE